MIQRCLRLLQQVRHHYPLKFYEIFQKLSEKRVFPAIDLARSSTRREDLLLTADEREAVDIIRKALNGMKRDEAGETIINLFSHTKTNADFVKEVLRRRML